jgi:hypothetical protein
MFRFKRAIVTMIAALAFTTFPAWTASAQEADNSSTAQSPLEAQVYILVANRDSSRRSDLPQVLEGVSGQLKGSLLFPNYRLGATFILPIRNRGSASVSGALSSSFATQSVGGRPIVYELNLEGVSYVPANGQVSEIMLDTFRFNFHWPVPEPTRGGDASTAANVAVSYQPMGLKTSSLLRVGVPAIMGTLATGAPDEQMVLVLLARRASAPR